MDFELMEAMANAFKEGAGQTDDMVNAMKNIQKALVDGALLGIAGDRISEVMDKLIGTCNGLSQKFTELQFDILGALADLRDEDHEAASRFKG